MMVKDYSQTRNNNNYELSSRVKRAVKQYRPGDAFFAEPKTQAKIANCILQHLHSNQVPFEHALVALAAPLVVVFEKESDIYYCFQRLMERTKSSHSAAAVNKGGSELAKFIMLLRSLHPDLSNHIEDEELEPEEWALAWLQQLLARELPIQCVLRLWDTYFAIQHGQVDTLVNFHPYVCLAILSELEEELMETEHPELKGVLLQLPELQMDRIITQAFDLREMAMLSGLERLGDDDEAHEEPTDTQLGTVPKPASF
eukprot:TRINITY_DN5718_c0_g1_i1.p1 TRINITY_DN5718_c0_g1~~TRINITY_DN5718_c0_g1_i1.p1  ORF type:complete len:257 (-),score=97.86 TRINITY_DN5718_c0_g1_i1:126-896(-)